MIKQTISYVNYNDERVTKTFWFHINKAELIKFGASVDGGMSTVLKNMAETNDSRGFINLLEQLVRMSYGVKSADGDSFLKDPAKTEAFIQSEAFVEMYVSMLEEPERITKFIEGIVPKMTESQKKEYQRKKAELAKELAAESEQSDVSEDNG